MLAEPYQTGSGVFWAGVKIKPSTEKRIEWLGRMNDRVIICRAKNDIDGLREIASEYAAHNMPQKANEIMQLAESPSDRGGEMQKWRTP